MSVVPLFVFASASNSWLICVDLNGKQLNPDAYNAGFLTGRRKVK
jgi:hypothetical protein